MITAKTYFGGSVQSLGFQDGTQRCTVGVVDPGTYDFGKAEHRETIAILTGYLTINGTNYFPGERCEISAGDSIQIEAKSTASYLCRYGE